MKTTFDLPEPLLRDVQRLARQRNTTAKSLVEQALRALLESERERADYVLPDRSVGGAGLQERFVGLDWAAIRAVSYGLPDER